MGWFEQLVESFEEHAHLAGKDGVEGTKNILKPVGYGIHNAWLEITLTKEGIPIGMEAYLKKQKATLMPCTAKGRTSGPAPHPLFDRLSYIAKDYHEIFPDKGPAYHYAYKEILSEWKKQPDAPPVVEAIYNYINKYDIVHDLLKNGIVGKKDIKKHAKDVVRFKVKDEEIPWQDQSVQDSYEKFYAAYFYKGKKKELCYATGKMLIPAANHAVGIRSPGDTAKLISSNDDWLVFRGRFDQAEECISVGYESSSKAMNMLSWLIAHQGYKRRKIFDKAENSPKDAAIQESRKAKDGRVFLAWGRLRKERGSEDKIPSIDIPFAFDDTEELISNREGTEMPLDFSERFDTEKGWADAMNKALSGYRHEFEKAEKSQVNVMVLDAMTKGRLAICYYNEMSGEDFIDRLSKWYTAGRWWQHSKRGGKEHVYVGVPSPEKIIVSYRGRQIKDKQKEMELERIFNTIVQGKILPNDMVKMAQVQVVRNARCIKKEDGEDFDAWKKDFLEPACSIVCNRINYDKEEYPVSLDETKTDRSYLFGRMLAVADFVERSTYDWSDKKSRVTNAMQYMERFASQPASTWKNIQIRLRPYEQKMGKYSDENRLLINEIADKFCYNDYSDAPLDGKFLLGFYCQQRQLEEKEMQKKSANNAVNGSEGGTHDDEVAEKD